jgi:NADH dehydrogenase FAD-containing subunit
MVPAPDAAPAAPKRVAVIGAGVAGLTAFKTLAAAGLDAFVVDPKPCFEFLPAAVECATHGAGAAHWLVENDPAVAAKLERGAAVGLSAAAVELADGRKLPFDYAIVAVGAAWPALLPAATAWAPTKAARLAELEARRAALAAAPAVIVAGGGTVGVELAAEVAEQFPGKKVTLITSGAELLPRMAPAARAAAAVWLADRGVELVLGQRVASWGGAGGAAGPVAATVTAADGAERAGLVFRCTGPAPSPALAAFAAGGALRLAPDGRVAVEPTLLARGAANIFAAGDAASTREEKTAVMADYAGLVAAQNVIALCAGTPAAELGTFPEGFFGVPAGTPLPLVTGASLGARRGVMQLGEALVPGWVAAQMRGFVGAMVRRRGGGSWLWSKLYTGMKAGMRGNVSGLAKKAAAQAAEAAEAAAPAS